MPKRIKKRRKMITDDGVDAGWEEYYDYIFPDSTGSRHIQSNIRLLELAKKWSKQKEGNPAKAGSSQGDDDEENEDADSDLSYEDGEEEQSDSDEESSGVKKLKMSSDSESATKNFKSIGEALR